MNLSKLKSNPFLLFLPFLLFFLLIVFKLHNDKLQGDEVRYFRMGNNLLQGYLTKPGPEFNLWSGPGYSIFLAPMFLLKLPLIVPVLFNAILQYLSIVLLFRILMQYVSWNKAFVFSLFWACYFLYYQELPSMVTEIFSIFLVTLLTFTVIRMFAKRSMVYVILSGVLLGWLALTKVIFGYVIVVILLISLGLWLLNRSSDKYRNTLVMACISMLVCLPYLFYTYSLTGKTFYWGNAGGMSLYWMSSPAEKEYGDWNNARFSANCTDKSVPCNRELIAVNHKKEMDEIMRYSGVARDDKYKEFAVANIKAHPVKYVKNLFSNICRMLFGFPNSFYYQSPSQIIRSIPNAIVLLLTFICLVPTVLQWRRLPFAIRFLLLFVLVYLGASSLVSAYQRQFYVIVPMLLVWLAYVLHRTVKVNFRGLTGRD